MLRFSRDGATPGHRALAQAEPPALPVYSVLAIACSPSSPPPGLLRTNGFVATWAVDLIATIGLYIAIRIPIYLAARGRRLAGRRVDLGRWYRRSASSPASGWSSSPFFFILRRFPGGIPWNSAHLARRQLRDHPVGGHPAARRRLVGCSRPARVQGPVRPGTEDGAGRIETG